MYLTSMWEDGIYGAIQMPNAKCHNANCAIYAIVQFAQLALWHLAFGIWGLEV